MVWYHYIFHGKRKDAGHIQESIFIVVDNTSVDVVLTQTSSTLQEEVGSKIFTLLLGNLHSGQQVSRVKLCENGIVGWIMFGAMFK